MFKSKIKFLLTIILFTLILIVMHTSVFASNENIKIIKKDDSNYLIYLKNKEKSQFKFAFSDSKDTEPSELLFKNEGEDSEEENANKIAYIDSYTESYYSISLESDIYFWAKKDDEYIAKGTKIDLSDSISEKDLQFAENITNIIEADTSKTLTTEKIENDKKITTTVGEILLKEEGSFSYIAIKLPNLEKYNKFMKLAEKISKLNSETDMYSKIEIYSEFFNLFKSLKPEDESGWIKVSENVIYQPEDAEDGDEYIVWIKDNKTGDIDVQFLTSTKAFSEEKVKESITTKLPVTYDNNILLIIFAILIIAIILTYIRIKFLKKKES